uniref:Protein ZBED8 n=1 Tax=Heterorhabditis bacteriophora TaxID=37862 RepID=A0A1I7WNM0_HETBA
MDRGRFGTEAPPLCVRRDSNLTATFRRPFLSCLQHKRFLDVLGISEEFARDVPQIMKNGFESIIEDIEKNEFHYSEDDHEKTFIVAVDPFCM